jgi:hypothetical protein
MPRFLGLARCAGPLPTEDDLAQAQHNLALVLSQLAPEHAALCTQASHVQGAKMVLDLPFDSPHVRNLHHEDADYVNYLLYRSEPGNTSNSTPRTISATSSRAAGEPLTIRVEYVTIDAGTKRFRFRAIKPADLGEFLDLLFRTNSVQERVQAALHRP